MKSKMAEIKLRHHDNKLRSSEYYSIRSGYDAGSKASVYWTPPTGPDGLSLLNSPSSMARAHLVATAAAANAAASSSTNSSSDDSNTSAAYRPVDPDTGLQLTPIHINYINENLDNMLVMKPIGGGGGGGGGGSTGVECNITKTMVDQWEHGDKISRYIRKVSVCVSGDLTMFVHFVFLCER